MVSKTTVKKKIKLLNASDGLAAIRLKVNEQTMAINALLGGIAAVHDAISEIDEQFEGLTKHINTEFADTTDHINHNHDHIERIDKKLGLDKLPCPSGWDTEAHEPKDSEEELRGQAMTIGLLDKDGHLTALGESVRNTMLAFTKTLKSLGEQDD